MKTLNPNHPIKKSLKHLALASAMVAASISMMPWSAYAAPITWATATTIAGDSDVTITNGTSKYAYRWAASNQSINGVTFIGTTSTTVGGSDVGLSGFSAYHGAFTSTSNPFASLSTAYKATLAGSNYNSGATVTVTLKNLTPGNTYQAQVWCQDARGAGGGRFATLSSSGGNSVELDYNSTNLEGGVGQYSIGTFTADAATQIFTIAAGGSVQLNALQVRDLGDPNPSAGPVGLQAIANSEKVSLSWSGKAGAVSYNIKRSLASGGPYTTIGNLSATSFTDSSVVNDTPYYYVVSALNPSETTNSTEISATPSGVNANLSTVSSSRVALRANGVESVTITATLLNSSNTPIANKAVSLAQTTGSGATITTTTGTTGVDGKAVFTATSTTVGNAVFTATNNTDNLVISQTAATNFVSATIPQDININFSGGTPEIASTLAGPNGGLGTSWNQFAGPNSTGTILDSLATPTTATITSNFGMPNTFDSAVIALPMLRGSMSNFGKGVDNTNVTINGLEAGGFYNIWMVTLRNQSNGSGGTEQYVGWWSTANTSSSPTNQLVNAVAATNNTSTFVAGYNYVLFEKVVANTSGKIIFTGVAGPLLDGSNNNHRLGLNGLQIVKTTAPVIGIVTNADSTVDESPATVFADGVLTSTVTVTLKDANSVGVPGKVVTLANTSGPMAATINPSTEITTNGAGKAVFTVSSTTPGIEVFTATDVTDTITLTNTASVEFLEIGVLMDAEKSTVVASPVARLADGSSTSTITATLSDANGYPVSGKNVTLANSGGPQAATISPASAVVSDINGQAVFLVSSSTIGIEQFTATNTTDTVSVTQVASVRFIDVNFPKLICVNIDNTDQPGLEGPIGGLGLNWNTVGATYAENLLQASGTDSTVGFSSSGDFYWQNIVESNTEPALRMLKRYNNNFNATNPQQLVINGLDSAKTYDLYIASAILYTSNQCSRGEWSTTNTTRTVGNQSVDNTLDENGSTWVRGNNYVLFEDVVPDGSGNISVTGRAITGDPFDIRLPLNGFQLVESVATSGYTTWVNVNGAAGQTPQGDHDNDGVENGIEFFMGETGSSFTATPSLNVSNAISWPASAAYEGTYEVQTSTDLATWTNVVPKPTPSGGILSYTLPPSAPGGKSFVRLLVTPTP